ncbi:MAG TPA: lipopolysaccharide kinase InaA family protein [Gammaproteobacteria bacterium]|nr:lipopolysaccharide kinase InaA family protein [Gammaproteobacteria bacterium]
MQIIASHRKNDSVFVWHDLHHADFSFNRPFVIRLEDDQVLYVEHVIRIIPRKRMVAFGHWQDQAVVAKLFFDPSYAKQHAEKDAAGINILQANKIPTPLLLYQGASEDRRIFILLFEKIVEAKNLATLWKNKKNTDEMLPLLKSVIIELATQHVLGILQHDMHLKNFLLADNRIYILDGAKIEITSPLLSKNPSTINLARFLAQLGIGVETYQKQLFRYYAQLRGWRLKDEDFNELFYLINKRNNERWQQFEKKIFRDSSDFSRFHHQQMSGMYDRSYHSAELMRVLKNPDAIFDQTTTKILKAGRSATVAKVILGDHTLVIKRYNMKNVWHRLRRLFRLTRAYLSWRLTQKFILFGITTAKPVAFIENRHFGLHGKSYFITEFVSGENAGNFFKQTPTEEESNSMIMQISSLLKNIAKLEMTHGDLKITNILIDAYQRPVLIDLDGAIEHLTLSSLHNTFKKEIKRFLNNFDNQLVLKEKFREILYSRS